MTRSLSGIKAELELLADVVNRFTSPAVQEKVAEGLLHFLLGGSPAALPKATVESPDEPPPDARKRTARRRSSGSPKAGSDGAPKRPSSAPLGGRRALDQLIADNYFQTKKSLGDIIRDAKHKFARDYEPGDFSSELSRKTRSGKLKREQNGDKQYVYWVE